MSKIERVTLYHGLHDPENPRSWKLNLAKIEAGGECGWGEAGTTYLQAAVGAPAIMEAMARLVLLGADPMANVPLSRRLAGFVDGAYHGGGVGFGAVAALDAALWDLKGKLLGQPVHSLLGGAVRRQLRAYANGWCYNLTEPQQYADAAAHVVEQGYTAMKFDPFRYDDGGFSEHPEPGGNTTRRWMRIAMERMAAVREEIGPDVDILLEAHGKFSPQIAIEIGRRFAEFDILFYEEPTGSFRPETMRRIADQQPIPLAAGERIVRFEEMQGFVEAHAFNLAQPDIGVCGGITASRRMAEYCETRRIGYQSHNSALGLNTAAAVQLSATLPNFIIQETFPFRPEGWDKTLLDPYEKRITNGYIPIPDTPGLGVQADEEWLEANLNKTVVIPE